MNVLEDAGYKFFRRTGEYVTLGEEEDPKEMFCLGRETENYITRNVWYWYRANGKSYRMTDANIPPAVKMAVMLVTDL